MVTQERLHQLYYLNSNGDLVRKESRGAGIKGNPVGTRNQDRKKRVEVSVDGYFYEYKDLLRCYKTGWDDFSPYRKAKSKLQTQKDLEIKENVLDINLWKPNRGEYQKGYYC